jgi:hypothetical protein
MDVIYNYRYDKLKTEVVTLRRSGNEAEWKDPQPACILSAGQNADWFPDLE